jgi:flagellar motor switch protein FliN/FliY
MSMTSTDAPVRAQQIDYPELASGNPPGQSVLANNMALLDSVKVSLQVVVGEAATTLGELMSLKEAGLLKIDRLVDQPVDVMVNGNVVARGQLVVIDDNFGVRVTEVAQLRT